LVVLLGLKQVQSFRYWQPVQPHSRHWATVAKTKAQGIAYRKLCTDIVACHLSDRFYAVEWIHIWDISYLQGDELAALIKIHPEGF
jgi:hypothetical protein